MKKLIIFYSILLGFFAFADIEDEYNQSNFNNLSYNDYSLEENKTDNFVFNINNEQCADNQVFTFGKVELGPNSKMNFIVKTNYNDPCRLLSPFLAEITSLVSNNGKIEIKHILDNGGALLGITEQEENINNISGNEVTFKINASSKVKGLVKIVDYPIIYGYNDDNRIIDNILNKGSDFIYIASHINANTKLYLELSDKTIKDLKQFYLVDKHTDLIPFSISTDNINFLTKDKINSMYIKAYAPIIKKINILNLPQKEKDEIVYKTIKFLVKIHDTDRNYDSNYFSFYNYIPEHIKNAVINNDLNSITEDEKNEFIKIFTAINTGENFIFTVQHLISGLKVLYNPIINDVCNDSNSLYKLHRDGLDEYNIPSRKGMWLKSTLGLDNGLYNTMQVGYNHKINNTLVGLSLAHRMNFSNDKAKSTSILGYLNNTSKIGTFELIPKVSFVSGNTKFLKYNTLDLGIKGKYSKEFKLNNGFSLVPEGSLTYSTSKGQEFKIPNTYISVKSDKIDSLIGELGLKLMYKGQYIKASVLREFLGDTKYKFTDPRDETTVKLSNKDTWFNLGIGGEYSIRDKAYLQYSLEKEFRNKLSNKFKFNLGVVF